MRFSPLTALAVLLTSSLAAADWSPTDSAWPSDGGSWGASTDTVTTTYIAATTVTMTLLQVQTATMHYYSANSTTPVAAASTPAYSSIDVSATPSVCANCNASTGDAASRSVNMGVAAVFGVGALMVVL